MSGLLAIEVGLATADEFGGIVETVEAGPKNELVDEELIDCVRQSAFSIELPASSASGRTGLYLTMPLGTAGGADAE